nr:MAG TPA: hypothetical protein [Caudoviricetes sp.]
MSWPLLFSIGLKAYFNQLTTADQSPAVCFCLIICCIIEES